MNDSMLAMKINNYVAAFPAPFHSRIVRFCQHSLQVDPNFFLPSADSATPSTIVVLSNFSSSQLTQLLQFVESLHREFLASPLYTIEAAVKHFYRHSETTQEEV